MTIFLLSHKLNRFRDKQYIFKFINVVHKKTLSLTITQFLGNNIL